MLSAATVSPIAAAIGVFGIVYGAAAQPLLGTTLTIVSSVVVFSGTVQFTMVGLLGAGSTPLALLWAVLVVNVRNLALGGALRPLLSDSRSQRLLVSWFLIDETVGLALASPVDAGRVMLRAGFICYLSWVGGTVIGVAGGATLGLEDVASAVFPVLFIGLASLMVRNRGQVVRAVAGGVLTLLLLLAWPSLNGLAPVIAGLLVAVPGGGS